MKRTTSLYLVVLLLVLFGAFTGLAATVTETFDSYADGTALTAVGGGSAWGPASMQYEVVGGGGVNGSDGLSTDISGSSPFNWKGQLFQWSALAVGTKVAMSLDFQSSPTGKFDDDRVGWTITPDASTSTGSQLALQLDNTSEGGMVFYHNATRTPVLNALTGIKSNAWYRFNVEFTKLTDTSAGMVGTLTELDGSGNPTGTPYVGNIADTSTFANPPSSALFTATQQCPSFKNYNPAAGNADNATFTITPAGPEPTVAITSPANNWTVGTNFTITATATDGDGTVTNVYFYDGSTLLGNDNTGPTYSYAWNSAPLGSHALTAVARDNIGLAATSAVVNITVAIVPPEAPAVIGNTNEGTLTDVMDAGWINACRFRAPSNMTVINMHAKVAGITGKYKCAIYSESGSLPSQFLRGTTELTNPTTGWQPFTLTAPQALTGGNYYWLAIWSDDANAQAYYSDTNAPLRFVQTNYAASWPSPIVTTGGGNLRYCIYAQGTSATLVSIAVTPANPTVTAGNTQQFTATGTYSDSSTLNLTSQVTWDSSSAPIATINSGGLATAVAAGTSTISATLGAISGNTLLTVQPAPLTITITSPANNATVNTDFTITTTTSGGGAVTNVYFYDGNTLLGNDTSSPYSYTWNSAPLGAHALKAVAQASTGLSATSTVVNVTVTVPNGSTFTETFDSYANGTVITNIGGGGVWASGTNRVLSTGGVNGSGGLSFGNWIFNWKAHTFQWSTLADGTKVAMSLDFQSSPTGDFDDDRVGWTITPDATTSTGSQFALQLDTTDDGGMVFYHNLTRTPVLNALTGIKNSTWYRFNVEFTKLGVTNAAIVGTLTELDGSGNPTGSPYVGTITNTSTFANPPSNTLFTATQQCPSFKNFSTETGNADNATFTITTPTTAAQYVIVISVDGMGSAYVTPLLTPGLANELTTFKRFQTEGAGTLNARTDYDYAVTLPNHTCMMTCRGVSGASGHNWTGNSDPAPSDTLEGNKGSYVASGFDVTHDNGLRTGIWAGKSKFSLFQQSYSATSGAPDTIPPDNGQDKIDNDYVVDGISAATLTANLTNQMIASPYNFVFLHYQDPDTTGHASGWSTDPASAYAASLKAVDTQIGRIMEMVENSPTLQGKTAIILTSDHGGHGTTHGDMSNPLDYTIPFYVWGAGVMAGGDLYALNPASRTTPGTTNAPYTGGQPVRNGDAANLALDLLDLGAIPGSTINSAQDLRVNADTPPAAVTLSLTGSPMAEAAGVATVTATLSETSASIVTVNLAFAGTATLTDDYTRSGASISIPAGSLTGSITLTAVQDSVYENPAETIVVDIDTVVNATESGTQQVTATFTDDDPVPPVITLLNQNFDSMGSAGTNLPAAWTAGYLGTVSTQNRLAMSPYAGNGLGITAMPVVVSSGSALPSPDVGTVFNLGSAGNSDRALGGYPRTTPSGDQIMQVAIVNTSGGELTSVDVSYAGEQWRQSQGTSTSGPEMLRFLASITSPTTGFTNFPSLDFTAPMQTTADAPVGGLDGNLAANRAVITGTITFASPVPVGGTFYLRWHDWNDNGTSDHFLGIDDVIVTTDAPTMPTVTLSLTGSLMAEAADGATVTATLSETSANAVTVNLAFSGTATLTTDYTRSGTSISILAGSLTGSITLTAVQDPVYENPDETIVVDIDTVLNATEDGVQQVMATITDDDPVSLVSIAVTPANLTITAGDSQQVTATGTYADSSTQDLTSQVTWNSSSTAVATIDANGLTAGLTAGTTTISATLGAVSGDTLLTVQPATPLVLGIVRNGDGSVTMTFGGTPGAEYLVLATTNLTSPGSWVNVSTNTADPGGQWTYTDNDITSYSQRFFRAAKP